MELHKNISIGKKLFASFGLICVFFIITGIVMYFLSASIKKGIGTIKNEVVPNTMIFLEIQKDIIQIQQWLTDISATRAAEGYDDGFAEAEQYYNEAVKYIELEQRIHHESGEKEMVDMLQDMKIKLDDFYNVGKQMAQAYIDGGPKKGNPLMKKFDPYSEKMTGTINKIVENHKLILNEHLEIITRSCFKTMATFITMFTITLLTCVSIGTVISLGIKKRVNVIKDAFVKAINGDLTLRIKSKSMDEIGMIANSYDELIGKLNGLISKILDAVNELNGSSKELSTVSDKMLDESVQTSEKANAVAAATEEMNVSMTNIASATEQASANIQMIVSAVEEMSVTIQEIANNTSRGREITTKAVEQAQEVSEKINKMGDSANEISKVTETISDISEQTNLLALNATIEAARAGEAGKGFAIVASEIKELAQQTTEANNDINKKISGVQNTTSEAVEAIRNIVNVITAINEIVATVSQSVNEQSETTREISNNITHVSSGTQEVNENINQASSVTAEVAQNVSDVSRSAQETNIGGEKVKESVKGLSDIADSLNEMIRHFKI